MLSNANLREASDYAELINKDDENGILPPFLNTFTKWFNESMDIINLYIILY